MKILNKMCRIFISFLIFLGLLFFYNAKKTFQWVEKRLLEKFEINIIVKESDDIQKVENYLNEITEKYRDINFSEKKLLTKNDIWNMVSEKEELKHFSTLITKNPFPDIFKLKLSNFDFKSLNDLFEEIRTNDLIKEIIYDVNIFSYLKRLMLIKKSFFYTEFFIFFCIIFTFSFSLYLIYRTKNFYVFESLFLFIVTVVSSITNYKMLMEVGVQFNFEINDFVVYFIIILITLSLTNLFIFNEK